MSLPTDTGLRETRSRAACGRAYRERALITSRSWPSSVDQQTDLTASFRHWGFNKAAAAKIKTPYLMITGEHDKNVSPQRVRELFEDLGSE